MRKLRFLVVEDNKTIRKVIVQKLQKLFNNVEITEADNGKEALFLFDNSSYQLVITDIDMPGMNGLDLCRKIKTEYASDKVAVVIITAKSAEKHIKEGFEAGADAYITKDEVSDSIIKSTVCKILDRIHLLSSKKILLVEKELDILKIVEKSLQNEGFDTMVARNGKEALELLKVYKADLIISEIELPEKSGIELLKELKNNPELKHIPFVISSSLSDSPTIQRMIEFGAIGYLTKPFNIHELTNLIDKTLSDQFQLIINEKERISAEREEFIESFKKIVVSIEDKIEGFFEHSFRVARYAVGLGRILKVPEKDIEYLKLAAELHEIGNTSIPDYILAKKDKLTKEEYEIVKSHPMVAFNILCSIPSLRYVAGIIKYHHERFDGTGYPEGLADEEIPLYSQILAMAETYDSMSSNRPYRKAMKEEDIYKEISESYGKQFSPKIVNGFLKYFKNELEKGD